MNKIDLIIDALENSKPINKESSIQFDKHLKALAAARELKALKPVAWITPDGEGFRMRLEPPTDDVPLGWKALYTTPPSKPWVGLTDETLDDVYFCVEGGTTPLETWREQARAIEAKLKEKNGAT